MDAEAVGPLTMKNAPPPCAFGSSSTHLFLLKLPELKQTSPPSEAKVCDPADPKTEVTPPPRRTHCKTEVGWAPKLQTRVREENY